MVPRYLPGGRAVVASHLPMNKLYLLSGPHFLVAHGPQPPVDVVRDRLQPVISDAFTVHVIDGPIRVAHDQSDGGEVLGGVGHCAERVAKCVESKPGPV